MAHDTFVHTGRDTKCETDFSHPTDMNYYINIPDHAGFVNMHIELC